MKVLMVTPTYFPIEGGTETAVRILATKLNRMGICTDVMTFNRDQRRNLIWREETEDNGLFKVLRVPGFNLSYIFGINPLDLLGVYAIPKPGFTKKFEDYDIIHFHVGWDMGFPLFSYFVRKPRILHHQGSIAGFPRLKTLFKFVFPRLVDLYVAYRPELLSDLGVSESKSLTLLFGVDVEVFRPDETKRLDNVILFVGRIARDKGLHVLLEALPYVRTQTQLVIIGPKWDMEYAENCEEEIRQIDRRSFHKVRYLGAMDESSLVPWYQKAAGLVRPDLAGISGGLTSLEALACGTPVVGTGNHVIIDGVNGILVPPNNPEELAKAIDKLLENRELREKFGREGRRTVEQHFSWDEIVKKLAKVYEAMLSDYQKS